MPPDRPLVLLVDNYTDNREMYAEYLRTIGFRVIACSDAEASLDLARMCIPDIILLELRMNRMNGVEVLAELQREPSLAHVPVVALTASVLSYERAIAMAAGFTELLPKPCFPRIWRPPSCASSPPPSGTRARTAVIETPPFRTPPVVTAD